MSFPPMPMMLNSTLPGVVLPLSRPPSNEAANANNGHANGNGHGHGYGYGSGPGPYTRPQAANLGDASAGYSAYFPRTLSLLPAPAPGPHSRQSSSASATSYSLPSASTGISSPLDSPPSASSITKNTIASIPRTTIRRARTGTTPYPREAHIHSGSDAYSSSSETEDLQMFHHQTLNAHHLHPAQDGYQNMYIHPSVAHIDPMQSVQQQHQHQSYGRHPMSPDHNLEQLASNVRSATTTSASDRAKQIFVHAWLNANYTPYADGNVPRQGLYSSYRRICDRYGIPHMNTATLGKAIRLCFPAIKTRRLGVRGNSKYHYCGIRPSNTTEAEWLQDYIRKTNTAGQNNANGESSGIVRANSQSSRGSGAGAGDSDEDDEADSPEGPHSGNASKRSSLNLESFKHSGSIPLDDKTPTTSSQLAAAQNAAPSSTGLQQSTAIRRRTAQTPDPVFSGVHPGAGQPSGTSNPNVNHVGPSGNTFNPQQQGPPQQPSSSQYSIRQLPSFPKIEEALGNASSSPQGMAAREVWRWFEDHLDALLEATRAFRFDQFELHLRTFWASLTGDHREVIHAPAVAGLMAKADALLYDEILETLRSQILAPIPTAALSSLRGLADQMEKVLLLALENYGSTFVEPKVELGARFGHLVLRFLDIYQVTQALATVLQNPKQLADMRRAWSEVDFESVRNQSALVCNCRHEDLIQLLEVDFVALLDGLQRSTEPVRDVMIWADDCCERLMGSNRSEERNTLSSRSVLIRWGYVTSQIMRDLTIRSDAAFGAFQILKLFLDDWIALNVLRAVALSTNSVAASVEPVMQQQFFTLSPPMGAGPDYTGAGGMGGSGIMDHTPTNILAALNESAFAQADGSFSSFDGSSSYGVGGGAYASLDAMNFMDHQSHGATPNTVNSADGLLSSVSGVDMTFGDAGFDASGFTQEFVMTGTPAGDGGDPVSMSAAASSSVKDEGSPVVG